MDPILNEHESGITDEISMGIVKDQKITVNSDTTTPSAKTYVIKRAYTKSYLEGARKMGETHLIVAALVATVAFTAGFTLPGGYNQSDHKMSSDEGMAVLSKHTAFKAFIVTDTIALVFSTSAIFIYLLFDVDEKGEVLVHLIELARNLILLAIEGMMIAFVCGTYAVLEHHHALAVTVCLIGCSSFIIHIFLVYHGLKIENKYSELQQAKVDQE